MSWRYTRAAMTSILTALTLSGCAIHQRLSQRDADVAQTRQTLARTQTSFEARTSSRTEKLKAQQVEKPWLVSRAVPLSRDVTLPAALRAKVNTTMLYRGGQNRPRCACRKNHPSHGCAGANQARGTTAGREFFAPT